MRRLVAVALLALPRTAASTSYENMQIELAIGGVNGDVLQQAVQLRMRNTGQSLVQPARLAPRLRDGWRRPGVLAAVLGQLFGVEQPRGG